MTQNRRSPGQRAAEALVMMQRWFPPALSTTAGFANQTGAIEIQLHDSIRAKVTVADGYRLAGWLFGTESYDFHDIQTDVGFTGRSNTARHHHWRGVYDGLAVTVAWIETPTPERKVE